MKTLALAAALALLSPRAGAEVVAVAYGPQRDYVELHDTACEGDAGHVVTWRKPDGVLNFAGCWKFAEPTQTIQIVWSDRDVSEMPAVRFKKPKDGV